MRCGGNCRVRVCDMECVKWVVRAAMQGVAGAGEWLKGLA